jgi:hypothetical protein
MKSLSSKLAVIGAITLIGITLGGCNPGMSDQPAAAADPKCDNTATLNSCGSFMPQNNESLGK